ncbi:MAG TPA: TonB family protein [Firmicutes bacterium]|nr:TonB family protein [Bacillota bacterium]
MGRKLRSQENLRSFYSFLLASGLHLLFFLLNWGAQWGVEAGDSRIIPVYSRVVVVEEKKPVFTETPAPVKKDPPAPEKEIPPEREAKAEVAEVVQEQPAPRHAPPVEKEERPSPVEPPGEETETPTHEEELTGEDLDPTPEEEGVEAEPALPPLGEGRGMVASYPMTYHKDLQHERVEGRVRLEVFLAADGKPLTEPVILRSSGDERLDEHCLKTVTSYWRFEPAPGPYKITVEVIFSQQEPRPKIEFLGDAVYLSPEGGDS